MTLQQILDEVTELPDADKWRLVRHLLDTLEGKSQGATKEDWPSFVNRMYGALADDPLERPSQLPLTDREPID